MDAIVRLGRWQVQGFGWLKRYTSGVVLVLVCMLGGVAFFYPFFLSPQVLKDTNAAHAGDAPILFVIVVPALLVVLVAEVGMGRLNAKMVAVLGVLMSINAVLRLPAGPGDSPTFFFLVILAGYVYGGQFGFLLGALSLFVSALLTGGVGPWMPFQMFAMGWMGLGTAGLRVFRHWLRPGGSAEIGLLCAYGYGWGLLFGALINVWFWPFTGAGVLYWEPGLGVGETLRRYWAFYVTTSLAWDSLRAIGNVVFIGVLGRPVLKELRRFQSRFHFEVVEAGVVQR